MTKSNKKNNSKKNQSSSAIKKNKISVLTCSQLKRIPFIHNLAKMINHQKYDIDECVIVNKCSSVDNYDKFNEEL